jgi:hypothetical protein
MRQALLVTSSISMEISRKKERCGNTRLVRVATLGSCREVHLDSGPNRLCNLSELFIISSISAQLQITYVC